MVTLSFLNNYSFDFSWMKDIKKWYSDIYISLVTYVIVTDIVLLLEKYCKMDQKPAFGYIWPFIGFFVSMVISNSINVEILSNEPRKNTALFFLYLIPLVWLMVTSFKTGEEINAREKELTEKATRIIKDNPKETNKILKDYDDYLAEKHNSKNDVND